MSGAEHHSFARCPAYGRPADLFRQLAALGVAINVVRSAGHVRLDYRIAESRMEQFRAVQAAFPSSMAWSTECVATLLVITGEPVEGGSRESEHLVDLSTLLASPPRNALAQRLLENGVRQ